jgi:hypothetical protein
MLKVVWRWCLPFLACSCYTLIAYAIIVHDVELEWRMLLAVLRWGLQIVFQALFRDGIKILFCPLVEDACGSSMLEMMPTNSIQPLLCIDCTCHWTLCCVWMDGDSCGELLQDLQKMLSRRTPPARYFFQPVGSREWPARTYLSLKQRSAEVAWVPNHHFI